MNYEWATEVMPFVGTLKAEPDYVTIVSVDGNITINDVGYSPSFVDTANIQASGDYLSIFDTDSLPLINPTHYSKISVNGVFYDNIVDLVDIILNL